MALMILIIMMIMIIILIIIIIIIIIIITILNGRPTSGKHVREMYTPFNPIFIVKLGPHGGGSSVYLQFMF